MASKPCICLKKWYINTRIESTLAKNPQTLKFIFYQVNNRSRYSTLFCYHIINRSIYRKCNLIKQTNKKALDDLDRGQIKPPVDYPTDLTFLRENSRHLELLRHVCKFDGYGDLIFPHCPCDSRKSGGHVRLELASLLLRLRACSREGDLETQVAEFGYERVVDMGVDDEEMAFWFEVAVEARPNKKIKIYTGFVSHLILLLSILLLFILFCLLFNK